MDCCRMSGFQRRREKDRNGGSNGGSKDGKAIPQVDINFLHKLRGKNVIELRYRIVNSNLKLEWNSQSGGGLWGGGNLCIQCLKKSPDLYGWLWSSSLYLLLSLLPLYLLLLLLYFLLFILLLLLLLLPLPSSFFSFSFLHFLPISSNR